MNSHHHPRIGILSDDLTSAADGAGPFVARGLSASVGRAYRPLTTADVVAIDAGTRSLGERAAMARCRKLTVELKDAGILYKTVDSTLRGHVRAEMSAVLEASGRKRLVFAPAFPQAGRTTFDGIQLVHGVPVDRSDYADDPVHPAAISRLVDLLPAEARNAIILNAATQDELNDQVAAVADPLDVLWVGSPGMAQALAARFPEASRSSRTSTSREVLIVVGSANSVSHEQADAVEKLSGFKLLRAPLDRTSDSASTLSTLTQKAVSALRTRRYGAVLATGGDTMEAILDALGIDCFWLAGEVEPGFPIGVADHGGQCLILGMKAGGFGNSETLVHAAKHLTSNREIVACPIRL